MRSLFDVYAKSRTQLWANAYPRPSIDALEKAWKLNLTQLRHGLEGIRVEADLDLDFSTFPQVLYQWEVLQEARKKWKLEQLQRELE